MRTVILECQNNGKALELRLEKESPAKYFIVLAGMTIHIKSGCSNDRGGDTEDDDYMFIENETYQAHSFPSYREAKTAFDIFKTRHID